MRPTRAVCLGVVLGFVSAGWLPATTYNVTTIADSGAGSLRQAITDANGAAGTHVIAFNIAGSGPHSIALATDLPAIAFLTGITIDGTTQPGFAGTPEIEIHRDGTFGSTCLTIQGTPTTIKALAINRCGMAISVSSAGALTLLGSRIGTDPSGTVALGNAGIGVYITNGSPANVIGGPNPGDRNIFSNHASASALYFGFSSSGTVRGNYFGVDATGTVAMPNFIGVNCSNGSGLVVGGSAAGQGNLISGSTDKGIYLQGCNNAVVQGNLIGTDVNGTLPIPNKVGVEALANNVKIGGTFAGEGNLISGNLSQAIRLGGTGTVVQGNWIGTDDSGTAPLGNGTGIDIAFGGGTLVGPNTPGGPGANLIAYNTFGVVSPGATNTVRGNSIHDNKFLGLDIGGASITANDPGDADNNQPNFPNVTSAVVEGAGVRVIGILESNASSTFDLDFYSNPACTRFPQDLLEGEQWLGTTPVTTDGSGHAAFNVLFSPVTVPPGFRVTATSTASDGSTSEFSQRIVLTSSGLTGNTSGSPILIQGMQFEPGATVAVGGVAATNVQWQADFLIQAQAPALPAGSVNNVVVTNPSGLSGTLPNGYVSSFADTEQNLFRQYIGGIVANGLTVGCGGPNYCPLNNVTRQQMAVFLLRGKFGLCYTPPPCTGTVFDDVQCAGNGFAPWVEALAALNITGGCGGPGNNFCPTNPVNRQQMAVFLLKAFEGSSYVPPACANPTFDDVPCSNPFSPWIYELALRQITGGCGGNAYCPTNPANRQQMSAFLVKTFSLPFL